MHMCAGPVHLVSQKFVGSRVPIYRWRQIESDDHLIGVQKKLMRTEVLPHCTKRGVPKSASNLNIVSLVTGTQGSRPLAAAA